MKILRDEVCEECKQLSQILILLQGYHFSEDIGICKACVVKAYDRIRQAEAEDIVKSMRPLG